MKKIKILTSVHINKVAGITQYVLSFADYIKRAYPNGEVEIVGVDMKRIDGASELREKIIENGIWKLWSVFVPLESINDLAGAAKDLHEFERLMAPVIREYEKIIKIEKPDIVLLSGTYHLVWCLYVAAVKSGIKKIALHYHGVIFKEVEKYNRFVRDIYIRMEKSYFDRKLFYIFPSFLAKQTVEKELIFKKIGNSTILPNPIPAHFFGCAGEKTEKNRRKIGFVTRWTHEKNPWFIQKLANLDLSLGKKNDICVIANIKQGTDVYEKLKNLVKFVPPMNNGKMKRFYRTMDVVLSPSCFETYGNIAQEAIACGTPAFVNENMGVAETLRKYGFGSWVIDFGNEKKVLEKIEAIAGQKIPANCLKKMERELSQSVIYGKLLELILKI